MALVRKRGRVGQWLGCGQKRLVGSHLPSESRRGNAKNRTLTHSGEGGKNRERKGENGHDTVVYPGISTRDKDHPRSRYSPTNLERGCHPRLTHEAGNTHDNVRHLRNVYHSLREGPVIKEQLIYAKKQKKDKHTGRP